MKKISYWIRTYFGFSQKEASGFLVILILILLFLFLPLAYKKFLPTGESFNHPSDRQKLDSLVTLLEKNKENRWNDTMSTYRPIPVETLAPTLFDPNKISHKDMLALGIENRMAARIINYRSKGGSFRIKKDLLKIYGFPKDLFSKLEPCISLPDSLSPDKNKKTKRETINTSFDINRADTVQLIRINGIGQIMASRILKYRDKLGGFINQDQLKEIYGLSPMAIDELKKLSYIKPDFIPMKLDLNFADKEALSRHPYLTTKAAMSILNYRKQHGPFKTENDFMEIRNISEQEKRKVLPYLTFDKNFILEP